MEQIAELGKIAGIGGIALGVFLLVFRDAVAPNIPNLSKPQAYRFLLTTVGVSFALAIGGIAAWAWVETHPKPDFAAQIRQKCLELAAASQNSGASNTSSVVSAGGNVNAGGDIRIQGADKLDGPGVLADCGDVTAGGSIEINADKSNSAD
jgi:hypothetical protein